MDNVAFHYSDRVRQMCEEASVKADALYILRTNPIEEFFGEIKTSAKSQHKSQRNYSETSRAISSYAPRR